MMPLLERLALLERRYDLLEQYVFKVDETLEVLNKWTKLNSDDLERLNKVSGLIVEMVEAQGKLSELRDKHRLAFLLATR